MEKTHAQEADIRAFRSQVEDIRAQIAKEIVGQQEVVDHMLMALIAGGNVLLEGVPGLGKTRLVRTLSNVFDLPFSRIQFTPDLMPADITGTNIIVKGEAGNEFRFQPGPLFASIVLADEINRATPRTQSALLECMEERQVTMDGVTRRLDEPFLVVATQNPIETQGTFPLPEAQLDRFLIKMKLGQLSHEDAVRVLDRFIENSPLETLSPVCAAEEIRAAQAAYAACEVSPEVRSYIATLCECTRRASNVALGVSPRGMLQLMRACQAYAMIQGRDFVTPDDVKHLAIPVLAHRVVVRGVYGRTDASASAVKEAMELAAVPTEEVGRETRA